MSREGIDGENRLKYRFFEIMKGAVLSALATVAVLVMMNLNASVSSADNECDCSSCHGVPHSTSCSGCHDAPPQTGTHLVHFGSAPLDSLLYGDTTISSTDNAYRFGCGNCHPLAPAKHGNGVVDVELADSNAPLGSIKAKNPLSAAYTPGLFVTTYANKLGGGKTFKYSNGTCNNVYCHSGYTVTSGPVGPPEEFDQYGNPSYAPYTVTYTRVYKTTPSWGTTGSFASCTECHGFPLTTSYPSVEAGVGDGHQWIDDYGYGNLHAYDMGFNPVSCRTCHYGTVNQANAWTRTSMDVTAYQPVPLASRAFHVNGSRDVIFDTVNPVLYESFYSGSITYDLSGAAYDPATKACSNVACHQQQTRVTWGAPYRWWDSTECNLCHGN